MLLVGMIKIDEDALICDLAETYNIYDFRQLPLLKVAVFACGLHENSRIKMKLTNQKVTLKELLLAKISDGIDTLIWFKTEDGQNNRNRPESIANRLLGKMDDTKETVGFATGEEFEAARLKMIGGGS